MSEMQLTCRHWWMVEKPDPAHRTLYATCRYCGLEREFAKEGDSKNRFGQKSMRAGQIKGGLAKAAMEKAKKA